MKYDYDADTKRLEKEYEEMKYRKQDALEIEIPILFMNISAYCNFREEVKGERGKFKCRYKIDTICNIEDCNLMDLLINTGTVIEKDRIIREPNHA